MNSMAFSDTFRLETVQEPTQIYLHPDECKKALSNAASLKGEYGERAVEKSDEVIVESGDHIICFTGLVGRAGRRGEEDLK